MSFEQLITDHISLVWHIARMIWNTHRKAEIDDLVGDGYVGLVQAARAFDPSRGLFNTFAFHKIRGAMLDAYRDNVDPVSRAFRRDIKAGKRREPVHFSTEATICESDRAITLGNTLEAHPELDWRETTAEVELRRLLKGCSPRDIGIAIDYWIGQMPMAVIGRAMGCTESRISQILARLKRHARKTHPCELAETYT